jgi:hypothetical protein
MNKQFARGGKKPMLGAGSRTRTAFPASPQVPNQTSQHAKPACRRNVSPGRGASDLAGSMGGSPGAAKPRLPAA